MASPSDNGLIESDLPQAVVLLNTLTKQVASVTSHVQELLAKVQEGAFQTSKGLSCLDLRYHLLLFYLQDLTHLISIKTDGGKIKDSEALNRVVLEKMRPLDHKLKYQIDKLVRTAVTGSLAQNDPLQLRPNPENLISKLSESEDSENEQDTKVASDKKTTPSSGKKYVPPKIAAVHYDGDMTETDKKRVQEERQKRVALRSSVIQELRQQYSDAPEEIRERRDFQSEKESREELHRKNYEESMMVRLNLSKREKISRKRGMMAMTGQLSGITHFSDITVLTGGEGMQNGDNFRPKKKKTTMKKNTKRKAFKKHR